MRRRHDDQTLEHADVRSVQNARGPRTRGLLYRVHELGRLFAVVFAGCVDPRVGHQLRFLHPEADLGPLGLDSPPRSGVPSVQP